ncbi:MAG: SUF system Fe-S cluster assembly protein [Rhodospirillaceae bacterium]
MPDDCATDNTAGKPDEPLYSRIVEALRTVYDPEIPVNIWELGLIYSIKTTADGTIAVEMTLTAPNCPVAGEMPNTVREVVAAVEGVNDCTVELVWEPPWDQGRMSDEAKVQLDMFY